MILYRAILNLGYLKISVLFLSYLIFCKESHVFQLEVFLAESPAHPDFMFFVLDL